MRPDTLIFNADIHTMDPARPRASWLLIRGGLIAALGTGTPPDATSQINAGGRLLLPGFQDAHIHLLNGGVDLVETAQLYDCTTLDDIARVMQAHAASQPGPVVWGAGWQSGFFGDHTLTRALLDGVVPDRPCLIHDSSGHIACVNSAALLMAGVSRTTPDLPGGHFTRDASGEATGMLHEDAICRILNRLPKTPDATFAAGLRAGQAHANAHGITGIIDPAVKAEHLRPYGEAAAAGTLTLRVAGAIHVSPTDSVDATVARLCNWRAAHHARDFQLNAAKFFMDGVLENRTAAMIDPYADARGGTATVMFDPGQLKALFTALDRERFQLHAHCIGDAATRATLDGIAAARAANGYWPALHQIAHCQVTHPDDWPRFAALGVMANLQPLWAAHDPLIPDATMAMIGPHRAPLTYACRSLIDAGARWCINSDWSVTTLNPFEIIGTAVTREPPRRRGRAAVFFPEQRMTVAEAILGYTVNAAAACWRSDFTGQLSPGYSADLILLDRDITTCDPYDIAETRVLLTLFKGREVHRAGDFGT